MEKAMAKTAAERQKKYRASRQRVGKNGERKINAYVNTRATLALERLAYNYVVTKRKLLEKLLIGKEDKVIKGFSLHSDDDRKNLVKPVKCSSYALDLPKWFNRENRGLTR